MTQETKAQLSALAVANVSAILDLFTEVEQRQKEKATLEQGLVDVLADYVGFEVSISGITIGEQRFNTYTVLVGGHSVSITPGVDGPIVDIFETVQVYNPNQCSHHASVKVKEKFLQITTFELWFAQLEAIARFSGWPSPLTQKDFYAHFQSGKSAESTWRERCASSN